MGVGMLSRNFYLVNHKAGLASRWQKMKGGQIMVQFRHRCRRAPARIYISRQRLCISSSIDEETQLRYDVHGIYMGLNILFISQAPSA